MKKDTFYPDWEMLVTGHSVLYKLLFLVVIFSSIGIAQRHPVEEIDKLLTCGINYVLTQKYDSAKIQFNQLQKLYPETPLGKIYLAALEIAKCYDSGEEYNTGFVKLNLIEAKEQAEELLDNDDENKWNYYYLALAEGYSAYFKALNDNKLGAVQEGLNSISAFNECLKIDNNFYESFIAIGSYKYWKSTLPLFKDEKVSGIELLKKAVDSSTYNKYLAINSLIWIYIDSKDFNSAVETALKGLNEFPESRYFKIGLARAYEDIDKKLAIKTYTEVLNSYGDLSKTNHYMEIYYKHLIAQQYAKIGDKNEAIRLCDEILSIENLSEYVKEKLGNRLERVLKLKTDLEKQ